MSDWTIHCAVCGCVSSTVRRDHDNVARCDVCYSERYKQGKPVSVLRADSFGNYDPSDALLDHLDDAR